MSMYIAVYFNFKILCLFVKQFLFRIYFTKVYLVIFVPYDYIFITVSTLKLILKDNQRKLNIWQYSVQFMDWVIVAKHNFFLD